MIALLLTVSALANVPSVHGEHAQTQLGRTATPEAPALPMLLPDPTPGPTSTVYGYRAYWTGDDNDTPWDELSHIALFSANVETNGALTQTSRWGDVQATVAIADMYGVKVHLCVTNFVKSELETILGSTAAKQRLISELTTHVQSTGVDGVNIDFENLPASRRDEMVAFIIELEAAVGEVVIATPTVDWSSAWDYAALTDHADLFIMGYGYHYSRSDTAGPVDPLHAGSTWSKWSLAWTIDDYLDKGADPDRVILGLPLYGYAWPTANNNIATPNLGVGSSVIFSTAWTESAANGREYDAQSLTPYYFDGTKQTWYGDVDSVKERVHYAVTDKSLGGVGVWALNYTKNDPSLWSAIADETTVDAPVDPENPDVPCTPDFTASTTSPFLAYVGDKVTLSGESSEGPSGLSLRYEWTQVGGPDASLDLTSPMRPTFTVQDVGTHAFVLRVGDGTTWSCPTTSFVAVPDPNSANRHNACGCTQGPQPTALWLLAISLITIRRRNFAAVTQSP